MLIGFTSQGQTKALDISRVINCRCFSTLQPPTPKDLNVAAYAIVRLSTNHNTTTFHAMISSLICRVTVTNPSSRDRNRDCNRNEGNPMSRAVCATVICSNTELPPQSTKTPHHHHQHSESTPTSSLLRTTHSALCTVHTYISTDPLFRLSTELNLNTPVDHLHRRPRCVL